MKATPFEILDQIVKPGTTVQIGLDVAKLHISTPVQIPITVSHAKEEGPVVLLIGGVHGDEINGVEIIRRINFNKWNIPTRGTVITIPILNIISFLNRSRELPDGRDLNRSFPGSENGSLAGQFAAAFRNKIAPLADYVLDFHTGGAQRHNFPQIRCDFAKQSNIEIAEVFDAPFLISSRLIPKTLRECVTKLGKTILLFEGGKSDVMDSFVVEEGIRGVINVLHHLEMTDETPEQKRGSVVIESSKWLRSPASGMFRLSVDNGSFVEKGASLGVISDPYGSKERIVKATMSGYLYCVNQSPIVHKGDALFHIGN